MSITIKQAFEKLAMVTGAAVKNPWFVGRNLNQAFADIAADIEGGGGTQDYSTTEVVIGKWVDGTSDVCRRVFVDLNSNLAGDDWTIINGVTIPNLQYVLHVDAYRIADDTYAGLPIVETMAYTDNSVRVSSVSGQTGTIKLAVITYVKASA